MTVEKIENVKLKFIRETKKFLFYFGFLFLFFGAFITYRRLVLQEYHVFYTDYGFAFIESLILAKIVMIGEMLGFGKRFKNKPLIFTVHL